MFRYFAATTARASSTSRLGQRVVQSRRVLTGTTRIGQIRGMSTQQNNSLSDSNVRYTIMAVAAAAGLSLFGLAGYAMFFGPGSMYPKPVRNLLREAGMAYMRPPEKQDLPKALECYEQALAQLDALGTSDSQHARDMPHVTGLVARVATVCTEMGDLDGAIEAYNDLLERLLGTDGMRDATTQVRRLLDDSLDKNERQGILRALGCANKLAETYEARGQRSKRRSAVLPHARAASTADADMAAQWYGWCLQLVMLTYQNHFNHQQLADNKPTTQTPSFDPDTLPSYFPVDIVTSLMYNAATFYSGNAQIELAEPLLQRALDLMRHGADGDETNVCRSSILMSHLANTGVMSGNLAAAERWSIDGLALAKRFPNNADCLNSFIALTYDLGVVYEAAGSLESARVQYRQAAEIATSTGDDDAAKLASEAMTRLAR